MRATSPTTRPTHTLAHLVEPDSNASVSGTFLLCRGNPADPLIAREGGNIRPDCAYQRVGTDSFSKINGNPMHWTRGALLDLLGHDVREAPESYSVVSEALARNPLG
jgi:hypothetical protein